MCVHSIAAVWEDNWYLFMSVHRSPEHCGILEETEKSQQEIEGGVCRVIGLFSTRPASLHWRTLYNRYAKWLDVCSHDVSLVFVMRTC